MQPAASLCKTPSVDTLKSLTLYHELVVYPPRCRQASVLSGSISASLSEFLKSRLSPKSVCRQKHHQGRSVLLLEVFVGGTENRFLNLQHIYRKEGNPTPIKNVLLNTKATDLIPLLQPLPVKLSPDSVM